MKRSKRLKPIAGLAHNSEREAAKALGQAVQVLNEGRDRLEQLKQYRQEYIARYEAMGSSGVSVAKINDYRAFLVKLRGAIQEQEKVVITASTELQERRRFWFSKRGDSKALDRVLERYQHDELYQEGKREQREQDDRTKKSKKDYSH